MSLVNNSINSKSSRIFLLTVLARLDECVESPSVLSQELITCTIFSPIAGIVLLQYESAWADAESKFLDANFLVL